ncbi:MAG: di-trans,poly-cis-decaprenylcistransferase [Phycisphaerae bacterium]|nr:di-trans,poly-cis-decaprenylcistransferase [Phycisphaerae bacterium]
MPAFPSDQPCSIPDPAQTEAELTALSSYSDPAERAAVVRMRTLYHLADPVRYLPGISPLRIPRHVAIIMDGNGRWAQSRGLARMAGHKAGARLIRTSLEECRRLGVEVLTLYSFSLENWKRPAEEVNFLMDLYLAYMDHERKHLVDTNCRFVQIGRREGLPQFALDALDRTVEATKNCTGTTLCLAVNYGARAEITDAVRSIARDVQAECARYDGEEKCSIRIEAAKAQDVAAVAGAADTSRVLTGIIGLPHGVLAVVPEIAGLVQTSNGTTTVQSEPAAGKLRVIVGCLSRSSSRPQLDATARQIRAIAALAGAEATTDNGYPGWSPNIKSPTLAACRRVYERVFGKAPRVTAIHAGLECGIIGERMGEGAMDMVSFGPNIKGAHSPDERVEVASVRRMYDYIVAVLGELAKA